MTATSWTKSSTVSTRFDKQTKGTNYLLLETGGKLLLETGGGLLLETYTDNSTKFTKETITSTSWT